MASQTTPNQQKTVFFLFTSNSTNLPLATTVSPVRHSTVTKPTFLPSTTVFVFFTTNQVFLPAPTSTQQYNNTTTAQPLPPEESALDKFFLWLPYIIFTIVLLTLIAISFLKFHCERENQYRRRQAELNDKIQHDESTNINTNTTNDVMTTSGMSSLPLLEGEVAVMNGKHPLGVPQHLNLFVQYTKVIRHFNIILIEITLCFFNVTCLNCFISKKILFQTKRLGETDDATCHVVKRRSSNFDPFLGREAKKKRFKLFKKKLAENIGVKKPVVFTFNCNGSMVDVRCEEEERSQTFRLSSASETLPDPLPSRIHPNHQSSTIHHSLSHHPRSNTEMATTQASFFLCPPKRLSCSRSVDTSYSKPLNLQQNISTIFHQPASSTPPIFCAASQHFCDPSSLPQPLRQQLQQQLQQQLHKQLLQHNFQQRLQQFSTPQQFNNTLFKQNSTSSLQPHLNTIPQLFSQTNVQQISQQIDQQPSQQQQQNQQQLQQKLQQQRQQIQQNAAILSRNSSLSQSSKHSRLFDAAPLHLLSSTTANPALGEFFKKQQLLQQQKHLQQQVQKQQSLQFYPQLQNPSQQNQQPSQRPQHQSPQLQHQSQQQIQQQFQQQSQQQTQQQLQQNQQQILKQASLQHQNSQQLSQQFFQKDRPHIPQRPTQFNQLQHKQHSLQQPQVAQQHQQQHHPQQHPPQQLNPQQHYSQQPQHRKPNTYLLSLPPSSFSFHTNSPVTKELLKQHKQQRQQRHHSKQSSTNISHTQSSSLHPSTPIHHPPTPIHAPSTPLHPSNNYPSILHPSMHSSTLSHQPFFSNRFRNNSHTIFNANRSQHTSIHREEDIENETLSLWQKKV